MNRKIVTTTSVYPPCSDLVRVTRTLSEIGYSGLDLAFDYCVQQADYPFMTDAYEEWANALRAEADACGVVWSHGHASFDASCRDDALIRRTLRCCQILGIRYLVVHPIWRYEDGETICDREDFFKINAAAYAYILSLARKYGVTVLTENLLWGASADPEWISTLVSEVAHPYFGWCYDTGHAHMSGMPVGELLACCAPLSLHIQDNHGQRDDHLLPGDGTIDWDEEFAYLRTIGYTGDFVLEAHHQPLEARNERERKSILIDLYMRAVRLEQDLRAE